MDHRQRAREILKKYPEIRELFGHEPKTKYWAAVLVALQVGLAWWASHIHYFYWLGVALIIGGVVNHNLGLLLHESSHNLLFKKGKANRAFSFFINLPLVFPSAFTFKKYHLAHHRDLGSPQKDVDLPSALEIKVFKGRLGRLVWLIFLPFFYSLRPMFVDPQKMTRLEIFNLLSQLVFVMVVAYLWGWSSILYLICSTLFGMSLIPTSGHFLSEHFTVADNVQDSYSYYGFLNGLTFNVGYHVEHHDFPCISWSRLPEVKRIAPEFYNTLYAHRSWVKVLWQFICKQDAYNLTDRVRYY